MTITETLKDAPFVVGPDGQPTATLADAGADTEEPALLACSGLARCASRRGAAGLRSAA